MGDDDLNPYLKDLGDKVTRMDRTIHGSDQNQGLLTRITLIERWVKVANKLIWLMVGSALATLGSAILLIVRTATGN
jgi:hypothetical protein